MIKKWPKERKKERKNIVRYTSMALYNDTRQANSKWTIIQRNQTKMMTRVRTDARERAKEEDDDAKKDGKESRDCTRVEL